MAGLYTRSINSVLAESRPPIANTSSITIVGRMDGMVMLIACLNLPAPSILAASYILGSIDDIDDKYKILFQPNVFHILVIVYIAEKYPGSVLKGIAFYQAT